MVRGTRAAQITRGLMRGGGRRAAGGGSQIRWLEVVFSVGRLCKDAVALSPTHLDRRTAAGCSAMHVVRLLSKLPRAGAEVLVGHRSRALWRTGTLDGPKTVGNSVRSVITNTLSL